MHPRRGRRFRDLRHYPLEPVDDLGQTWARETLRVRAFAHEPGHECCLHDDVRIQQDGDVGREFWTCHRSTAFFITTLAYR